MAFGPFKPVSWKDVTPRKREPRRHAPYRTTEEVAADIEAIKARLRQILAVGPRMKKELWKLFPKAREDDLAAALKAVAYAVRGRSRYPLYHLLATEKPK